MDRRGDLYGASTGKLLEWFSVLRGGVRDVIIPHDKMVAYFIYEFALHTLSFIVSGKKHHEESLDCVFGFKQNKTQIVDSMKAGALCDDCKRWFGEMVPT